MTAPALACRGLRVGYDDATVLRDVDLDVAPGELVALLGPSGSGKTTLLYAIAGFVRPSAGTIHLAGELVADAHHAQPPERRGVAVVFQSYALWPHLSAVDTVAYPLRRRGLSRVAARRRAVELLADMGIAELAERRPAALSGGQQQRVGVARALARDADLYLFDEPTAHLDAMLRERLATQMLDRRAEQGAAAIYATHDAGEALAVADRVALLRHGRVIQVGTPQAVFERPVDAWAAHLTGSVSLLSGRVARRGEEATLSLGGAPVSTRCDGAVPDGPVVAVVRPGWACLGGPLTGTVRHLWFRGPHTDVGLEVPGGVVTLQQPGPPAVALGDRLAWRLERAWLVPPTGEPPADGG